MSSMLMALLCSRRVSAASVTVVRRHSPVAQLNESAAFGGWTDRKLQATAFIYLQYFWLFLNLSGTLQLARRH